MVVQVVCRPVGDHHLTPAGLHTAVRVAEASLGRLGGVAALKYGICRVCESPAGYRTSPWWLRAGR